MTQVNGGLKRINNFRKVFSTTSLATELDAAILLGYSLR